MARKPGLKDIRELTSFLPTLYADDFRPSGVRGIEREDRDGHLAMPWHEYDDEVQRFTRLIVERGCWMDPDYSPEAAQEMLDSERAVKAATLDEIRVLLTYVERGERFCPGWWSKMIEEGHVRRILERLGEIGREGRHPVFVEESRSPVAVEDRSEAIVRFRLQARPEVETERNPPEFGESTDLAGMFRQ